MSKTIRTINGKQISDTMMKRVPMDDLLLMMWNKRKLVKRVVTDGYGVLPIYGKGFRACLDKGYIKTTDIKGRTKARRKDMLLTRRGMNDLLSHDPETFRKANKDFEDEYSIGNEVFEDRRLTQPDLRKMEIDSYDLDEFFYMDLMDEVAA